ncbi:diacylglycerol/lipid kinase family protein [Cypionkella sp.]|uniref:diacylglycerol/lipid kinase family protein n=1 Tax=Cypionkella sp. TaxID=2811411 RepID=UPI002AB8FBD3|nr:diacylglycerol kinase family protein [Cypionkella sp.]MDZ4395037.1 diacylglycerol kinase family protein [Cypionkella sp.]
MTNTSRKLDLPTSKLALVLNGAAGKKDALANEDKIRERLTPNVGEYVTYSVRSGADIAGAAQRAAREGADVVVALGGDGTQSAVAGALAGSDTVMGVLPGGTFNYFARELGVGETLDAALDTLLSGRVGRMDVGEVNGRIFLNNASFGVYPKILERREAVYKRWGRSRVAAYWSVLLTLWELRDPMHLSLTLDGAKRDFRTPLAFVARSAYQLDNMGLEGAEAVRDGQLALFLVKGHSPRHLITAAFRLAIGKTARGQDFDLLIADEILIETRQLRRLLAFDGEKERATGPFRLRVQRDALSVIVPAEAAHDPVAAAK